MGEKASNASKRLKTKQMHADRQRPEPEALTVGQIDGRHLCFYGIERDRRHSWCMKLPYPEKVRHSIFNSEISEPSRYSAAGDLGLRHWLLFQEDSQADKHYWLFANEVACCRGITWASKSRLVKYWMKLTFLWVRLISLPPLARPTRQAKEDKH